MEKITSTRRSTLKKIGAIGIAGVLSSTTASAASRREITIKDGNFEVWFTSTDVEGENDKAKDNTISTKEKNNDEYGYVSADLSNGDKCVYSIPSESFIHMVRVNGGSGSVTVEVESVPDTETEADVEFKSMDGSKSDYDITVSGSASARDNCETTLQDGTLNTDGYGYIQGRVIDGEDTYDISGQFSQMTLDENIQLERYA
nr:hypothetical protein [Haloferax larsenii]